MAPFKKRLNLGGIGWAEGDLFDLTELGDRKVPRHIDVHLYGADGQPQLDMVLEVLDGVPQCRDLRVTSVEGGREVRPLDLREVTAHLAQWVELFFAKFSMAYDRTDDGGTVLLFQDDPQALGAGVRAFRKARTGKGARTLNEDFLTRVAKIYTENPSRPTRAVRDAFGVSDRMASTYVRKAREAGLLSPRS